MRRELEEAGATQVNVDLQKGLASWENGPSPEKAITILDEFGFKGAKDDASV